MTLLQYKALDTIDSVDPHVIHRMHMKKKKKILKEKK